MVVADILPSDMKRYVSSGLCMWRAVLTGPRFDRLWGAYMDDHPFSLDLGKAIIRQCRFVDKMYDLGWTKRGFFDDKVSEVVLMHCLSRYHA